MAMLAASPSHGNEPSLFGLITNTPPMHISLTPATCSHEAGMIGFSWADFPAIASHDSCLLHLSAEENRNDYDSYTTVPHFQRPVKHTPIKKTRQKLATPAPDAVTTSNKQKSGGRKMVSFANAVQIRTHDVVLGDHPCCPGGMALVCDWSHSGEEEVVDLEVFEMTSQKRRQGELRMSLEERRERLQSTMGISATELLQQEYELVFGFPLPPVGMMKKSSSSSSLLMLQTPSVQRALADAETTFSS